MKTQIPDQDTSVRIHTPQAQPQKLASLVEKIVRALKRYLVLPPYVTWVIAYWIVHTYCFDQFRYTGYLDIRSPLPRCGKTRLLQLICLFAFGNPRILTLPTAATIFRSGPRVLILDEVDHLSNMDKHTHADVLAVLNVGFARGAVVERLVPTRDGDWTTKTFDVYGPKAFAGIAELTDTLADRTFTLRMRRASQRMPRIKEQVLEDEAESLRTALAQWVETHSIEIVNTYNELPNTVEQLACFDDRFQDIAEPLVVLASLADAERPEGYATLPYLVQGLKACAQRREPSPLEEHLSAFLRLIQPHLNATTSNAQGTRYFLSSERLVHLCGGTDELSAITSAKALANFLKKFELHPQKESSGRIRGYWIAKTWVQTWGGRDHV